MKPQNFSISDILTRTPQKTKITSSNHSDEGPCSTYLGSIPTPPQSPERQVQDVKQVSREQKSRAEHPITEAGEKRKRDPIGQLLDSLCDSGNQQKNKATNNETGGVLPSAFSPIITSSMSSQLSPLSLLSQFDRRCMQASPAGIYQQYAHPSTMRTDGLSPERVIREHLQYMQMQHRAQQQQQQQQQHHQQHQHLQSSLSPYVLTPHRVQPASGVLRGQHDFLPTPENNMNSSIIPPPADSLTHHGLMASAAASSSPFWMAWLKSASQSGMTSQPIKEPNRIPPPPRYQCDACKKSYSTFGGLSKHKQFHCVSHVKKEFNCKYCEKSYGSLGALKMHIRTHTLPCKCKLCGKAFSRPWLLQGHVRTHTGEKPFKCAHCGRAFADRSNLRAHLQTHSDVKKYGCKNCSKTFSRMSLLLKHEDGSCLGLRR